MEINNTKEIKDICQEIVDVYKNAVKDSGHSASGELAKTARYKIKWDGKWFELSFVLQDYWKYIENGTRAHFPPSDAIEKWIRAKRIIPSSINGKVPTTKQLAFLIARGISKNGTPATKLLQKSMDSCDDLINKLVDAIINQIEEQELEEDIL